MTASRAGNLRVRTLSKIIEVEYLRLRNEEKRVAAALPFFEGLSPASVDQLMAGALLQRFPAQAQIIRQGEQPAYLHVVAEGRVEVFARHNGRDTTINVLGEGHSFILAAVFLDKGYLKSARALSPVRLLLVPAAAVRAVFRCDPAFAAACAAELARGYRTLVKEVSNLKLRSSLERLANWLLHEAEAAGAGASFVMPYDKKTLAGKLGIAPAVLSRNFAMLASHGAVVAGRNVTITDMAALRAFATPSQLIDDPSY